ncbi:tetratricopeptide repeat protein [Nocardiopsis listeri]|uniref:tetratricopeptide repeat protein n=1 Tax=Nocardiopsis listeri TaxID=53440 RepID=UPI00082A6989|nr:tetratricopeptide repeat protein [Nocardiopsis listeri]
MAPPPDAHNSAHGAVYGQLLQVHDIHGDITVNPPQAPTTVADVSLDPPRPATTVRGRDGLMETLRNAMMRGVPVPHVLTGPGGFGKTTVAAALAEHARAEGWTVFWVRPDAILPSMLEVAVEMGASRTEAEQVKGAPRSAARWVWRHLDAAPRPWLLVLDNADRPELLDPENRPGEQRGWMRSSPGGFVLVTSRVNDPALWAPATMHRVEVLNPEDAAVTLADHAGVGELPGATELAERLGGVPIALSLAGRVLATHQVLFPDAQALLSRLEEDVTELDELAAPPVTGADGERKPLSGVWELSLGLVTERHPHAVPLLRVLSLLGAQGQAVPLHRLPISELAGGVLDSPEHPLDEVSFARSVNALVSHGLVRVVPQSEEHTLLLHPLIAETVSAGLNEDDVPLLLEVDGLLERQGDRDPHFELAVFTALGLLARRLPVRDDTFRVRMDLAGIRAYLQLARFTEAERAGNRTRDFATESLGPIHPLTLQARHLLAEGWLFQDRVSEADQEYLALLADRERVLGVEAPRTLDTRHQLALVAGIRGDWAKARERLETLLEARLRLQGVEDTETLAAMDALGYAAMRSGDLRLAEQMINEVHDVRCRLLGERNRLTLNSAYKMGLLALRRGDRSSAREIFRRVLSGRIDALGPDHPETRLVRDRLAETPISAYRERGHGASG